MTETITPKSTQITNVPKVNIDAPLKAPIEQSTEYEPGVTPKNKRLYALGLIGTITVCLLTLGVSVYYFMAFRGKSEDKTVAVKEIAETPEAPIFDKSTVTFEVLNGSGVVGAAKKAAGTITSLGYNVSSTGNSEEVKSSQLFISPDIKKYSSEIISDLKDFDVSEVSGELLEGSASARLILGVNK